MSVKEPELVTLSSKGQIVIPQSLRKELGLSTRNKFLVYGKKDTIVIKKIKTPQLYRDWGEVFDIFEKKKLKLTSRDVQKEIESYRREKRLKMSKR